MIEWNRTLKKRYEEGKREADKANKAVVFRALELLMIGPERWERLSDAQSLAHLEPGRPGS